MNIIFLDIDGVFNNIASFMLHRRLLHDDCLEFFLDSFKEIQEKIPDIKTVISSTWRKTHDFEHFVKRIEENSPNHFQEFLNTIHEDWRTPIVGGFRGNEINAWLEKHPEVDKFLCIDDDSDFHPNQPLLKTANRLGFTHFDGKCMKLFFLGEFEEIKKDDLTTRLDFEQKLIDSKRNFIKNFC